MVSTPNKTQPLAEFFWRVRAYIEDTDAGGIVYHGNYLNYMERARTESLRALGFDKTYVTGAEILLVVHSLAIDYKQPAVLDDELLVEAHVMGLKRTSITFRQNILRGTELLTEATVKIACINKNTMRPVAMPDELSAALRRWIDVGELAGVAM
ncbi:Acyl-CoA thioesterase YbgC [BD1-7 clade bacterium]|uniref:Acyl-CoA thioesterase YbgC n=1 Tax=BD1-7 clade bacterium TaxID=2029982 RepID=A0A5S9MWE8_9GAMM|nr:Acyl-CoA thioesterase YbgC [BD1-7 clade bacterium]